MHVYIPNTGRLTELLIPGRRVILTPSKGKYAYKCNYVICRNKPVLIDSIESNNIFQKLIETKRIPELKDFIITAREPAYRNHRFDFIIDNGREHRFVEIKLCTLAWRNIASFPNAVTTRGTAHIKKLSESGKGILFFMIMHSGIDLFVPNYHTDYTFYRTFMEERNRITALAYSVIYRDYEITGVTGATILTPEREAAGCYLLLYRNRRRFSADIGALGRRVFPRGFYVYVGSGMRSLFSRIGYHQRKSEKRHWHLDYIKDRFSFLSDIPIVTSSNRECDLSRKILENGGIGIDGFGSTDCRCNSHLYFFESNPLDSDDFWEVVLAERFEEFTEGD